MQINIEISKTMNELNKVEEKLAEIVSEKEYLEIKLKSKNFVQRDYIELRNSISQFNKLDLEKRKINSQLMELRFMRKQEVQAELQKIKEMNIKKTNTEDRLFRSKIISMMPRETVKAILEEIRTEMKTL